MLIVKGTCPRGNNKVVIILFHVYNRCLFDARIVLTGNINTCVFNKQARVPSKVLWLLGFERERERAARARGSRPGSFPTAGQEGRVFLLNSCLDRKSVV